MFALGQHALTLVQLVVRVDLQGQKGLADPLSNAGGEVIFLKRVIDGWFLGTCMSACVVCILCPTLTVLKMFPTT